MNGRKKGSAASAEFLAGRKRIAAEIAFVRAGKRHSGGRSRIAKAVRAADPAKNILPAHGAAAVRADFAVRLGRSRAAVPIGARFFLRSANRTILLPFAQFMATGCANDHSQPFLSVFPVGKRSFLHG